jgi:hypothetical protein
MSDFDVASHSFSCAVIAGITLPGRTMCPDLVFRHRRLRLYGTCMIASDIRGPLWNRSPLEMIRALVQLEDRIVAFPH